MALEEWEEREEYRSAFPDNGEGQLGDEADEDRGDDEEREERVADVDESGPHDLR